MKYTARISTHHMLTLGVLHWRREGPPLVGSEKAFSPGQSPWRQAFPPQFGSSKPNSMPMLKPSTRLRLHWRKLGLSKLHSKRRQPPPSGQPQP